MKQLTTTKMKATCPICGSLFEFEPDDIMNVDDPDIEEGTVPGVECPACEFSLTMDELKRKGLEVESSPYEEPEDESEQEQSAGLFGRHY